MEKEHSLSSGAALTFLAVIQACGSGATVWHDVGGTGGAGGAGGRATGGVGGVAGAGASSGTGGRPGGGASGSGSGTDSGGSPAMGGSPDVGESGSSGSSGAGAGGASAGAGGQPSCDEIKANYVAALDTARSCSPGAAACQVSAAASLDCGCPVYVNDDAALRPLARAWKNGGCSKICPIACVAALPGNCDKGGHCVNAPK